MKTVKIILLSFCAILVCGVIGLVIFLRTFDLNVYVPKMTEAMTKALGRDVKIGRADLGVSFSRGVTVSLSDIVIMDDPRFLSGPFLVVGRASLGVDFKEFIFKQKLVIGDITIDKLVATVIRNKEGLINVVMMGPAKAQGVASDQKEGGSQAVALPVFLIKDIKLVDARLVYIDEAVSPKMTVNFHKIDLGIRNFSLIDPFSVLLKGALFADEQDIQLEAKIKLELKNLGIKITESVLQVDLSKISQEALIEALPAMKSLGLQSLKGLVTLNVESAMMNILGLTSLKAHVLVEKGYLLTSLSPVTIDDFGAKVALDAKNADIQDIFISVAGGTIKGKGAVEKFLSNPQVQLTLEITGIDAGKISTAYKLPVKMNGFLQGSGAVSFSGKTPEEVSASLNAQVKADLKEGALEGLNVLQSGMANVALLSGMWSSIVAELPVETQEDLKKGVTLIDRAGFQMRIQGADLVLDQVDLLTRDVAFSALGTAKIGGTVDIKGNLLVSPKITDVFVGKIPDLSALRDQDGRIRVPIIGEGALVAPKIHADEKYLTKTILLERGKKELEKISAKNPGVAGGLGALFGGKASDGAGSEKAGGASETSATTPQGTTQEGSSSSQAVNTLLNAIFDKK
ncbi:MAG: AsmA family protein [Candidatus Omnitrophica bacterium]|nr:AsmA family protein [Candidatus Omnitrophota bacterium]